MMFHFTHSFGGAEHVENKSRGAEGMVCCDVPPLQMYLHPWEPTFTFQSLVYKMLVNFS